MSLHLVKFFDSEEDLILFILFVNDVCFILSESYICNTVYLILVRHTLPKALIELYVWWILLLRYTQNLQIDAKYSYTVP